MKKLFTFLLLTLLCCVGRADLLYTELQAGTYYFFKHVSAAKYFNCNEANSNTKTARNIFVLEDAGKTTIGTEEKQLYYIKRVDDDKYVAKRTGEYITLCDATADAEPFYLGYRPGNTNHVRFYCTSTGNTGYWLATNGSSNVAAHYQNTGDGEHSGWLVTEAPRWKEMTTLLSTAAKVRFGSSLGQYTGTNTDQLTSAVAEAQALTLPNATVAGVETLITNLGLTQYSLSLNMPSANSFLRIKSTVVDGAYVTATGGEATSMALATELSKKNLLYYQPLDDNKYFVVCSSGRYVNNKNHAYYSYKSNMTISEGGEPGTYRVKPSTGDYWMSPSTIGNVSTSTTGTEAACDWTIEEINTFPITMNRNTAGSNPDNKYYASLYLPKAVTLPAGMKAYSATATNATSLSLTLVASGDDDANNVLAANTPVILCSDNNVTELPFATAVGVSPTQNVLQGSLQSVAVTSGANYVLGGANGIGFYKYNTTETPPFKAYLPASSLPTGSVSSNSFSFVFDDDDLTAISEAVKRADAESNLIYDLNGNIVNNPQKGHIYIRNNKTVKF
ncbi:MAG: hypothetical protein PUD79_06130 [Prevotellaceae bacterium]|nr:hypothetical protein [Prevotellaceae bacterium]